MHPATGDLFHHGLQFFALAEGVEDRRDGSEFQGIRAQEHQVVEHPVQLCQQGPAPGGTFGHVHVEHRLDSERDADLVAERGQPIVAVGQHHDLAIVAHLKEFFGAAVHVADDRLGGHDALAVGGDLQSQHPVRGRMLRADVEHHLGRTQASSTDRDVHRPAAWRG